MNCFNCNKLTNLNDSIKLYDYSDIYTKDDIIYCKNCWENKNIDLICNNCMNFYAELKCNKNCFDIVINDNDITTDYKKICMYCLCDGNDCEYCNKINKDYIYDLFIKKKNIIYYKFKNYFNLFF